MDSRHFFSLFQFFSFLLLLTACEKSTPTPAPPTPVSVFTVTPQALPQDFEYIGVVASSHIVELRARVEGYLEKIAYKEGSLVQKGQLMFVVDPRPFEAKLDEAQALLVKQKALLWNADQIVARLEPLYQQKAVSQKDLDDAIAQQLALQAQVDAAKANVETAALNLSFTQIQAPVTSMSSDAKFREGALISPGPDSLLTDLYVIDPIWVNFNVSEGDILKARKDVDDGRLKYPPQMNFAIDVILADNTHLPAQGKVDFTNPSLQQSTGTMSVRAVLPNPKGILRPGQFVRVVIKGAVRPEAIAVPQTAVQQGQKGMFVFVVDSQNKVSMRSVQTGPWYGSDYWIIDSGLTANDRVIFEGVNRVHDGSVVSVNKTVTGPLPESS